MRNGKLLAFSLALSWITILLVTSFLPVNVQAQATTREDCWIDVKTGKQVPTVPLAGVNMPEHATENAGVAIISDDRKTAINTRTGQNFARVPCPPATTRLANFDTNHDGLISSPEFFTIVDAWIAGQMDNETFFKAVDLWIAQQPISGGTTPSTPTPTPSPTPTPTPKASCPSAPALVFLQNGIPIPGNIIGHGDVTLGVAFLDGFEFLDGSSVQVTIDTDDHTVATAAEAFFRSPIAGTFQHVGQANLLGNGFVRSGGAVQNNFEIITFSLAPLAPSSTNVSVSMSISSPNCSAIQTSGGANVSFQAAAMGLRSGALLSIKAAPAEEIRVELFDASGHEVFISPLEREVVIRAKDLAMRDHPLAAGLYFYVIITKSSTGIARGEVRKLVLLR
ncbi:hypothetical protein HYR53_04275 [Candidatus Acetothermia bacterium]|nr:hypothetical protein [Candidatus Acetothermia bacterium]